MKNEPQNFNIEINGREIATRSGQTVAAAMITAGIVTFRRLADDEPRGLFCGMGICFDCLVTIDGIADQRACMTPVQPGMKVTLAIESKNKHEND